ncbi:S46 family peptidase [Candidatus Neptunichlamydia sp. REUL1]|uniref:S46 family peptidase n=1 Tax=Candidatus Neptunichlamydia sp. REUL1 TaxID=3064277 RepID=UPI00292D5167|nr:S46 family peptidase [Candidatus Neptunochlamydia sp. REUL1]
MKSVFAFLIAVALTSHCFSDEGMWPLNQIPQKQIYESYGEDLDEEWATHAQQSCLRVSFGGSASFVSPNGLVMTNHHVGSKAIYDFSTEDTDLMKEGFYAESLGSELKCPNAYMDQLISIRDVTSKVNAQIASEMSLEEREEARKGAIAKIKENAQIETHLQPEIVTLYQGARYHLYLYKRFTDIRLVMAPEENIAFFGGDIENFEFPSHDLDVAFFRIYDNGQPLQNKDYFRWSASGPKIGEPLFVLGHPGRTERLFTKDHLCFYRDYAFPFLLEFIQGRIQCLNNFAKKSEESTRVAAQEKSRYSNVLKAYSALAKGLNEKTIILNKSDSEATILSKLSEEGQRPWKDLSSSLECAKSYFAEHFYLEGKASNFSKMFTWARHLLRHAEERSKSNELRLKEYIDSELPTLELSLLTVEPVYIEFERELLTHGLSRFVEILGENHPATQAALTGKSVENKVDELINGTRLFNLGYRRELFQNPETLADCDDSLICLARALDPFARELREKMTYGLDAAKSESYAKIAGVLFEHFGESMYPDATFTLRLSVGKMMGYHEETGYISPTTTLGEAYHKAIKNHYQAPYALPTSWQTKQGFVNEDTPFNFASTHDIIGGNSGSPVINAQREIVGLIFDGNMQSLTWDFEFDQNQGRAVSVHSEAILHTLEHIYNAKALVSEIRSSQNR